MPAAVKSYRIGQLARATGLTPDTLRFYERRGLLATPARTPGRFRVYAPSAVERVRFIRRAQALGFTLDEIGELIGFNGTGDLRRCARVRTLLRDRLGQLDLMLAELGRLRETLGAALQQCDRALDARDAAACPVIAFDEDDGTGSARALPRAWGTRGR